MQENSPTERQMEDNLKKIRYKEERERGRERGRQKQIC
jgi:hypothetical protein